MNRRSWMKTAALSLGGGLASKLGVGAARAADAPQAGAPKPGMIVLYCDLAVVPAKEKQMLDFFHNQFKPAGAKFKGFIDLKILKYDHKVQGAALPSNINYRFQLTYESLALQQAWVNSDTHKKLWPGMAATLSNPDDFQVLVFNNA